MSAPVEGDTFTGPDVRGDGALEEAIPVVLRGLPHQEVLACKRVFHALDGDSDGMIHMGLLKRTELWRGIPCDSLEHSENAPERLAQAVGSDANGFSNLGHWIQLMERIWERSPSDFFKISWYFKAECHELTQAEDGRARDIFEDLVSSQDDGAFAFIPLHTVGMAELCGTGDLAQILGGNDKFSPHEAEFTQTQWLSFCLAIKRHRGHEYLGTFLTTAQSSVGLTPAQRRQVASIFSALDPKDTGTVNYLQLVGLSRDVFCKLESNNPLPEGTVLPEVARSSWPVRLPELTRFFERLKRDMGPTWLELTLESLMSIPEIEAAHTQQMSHKPTTQPQDGSTPGVVGENGTLPRGCVSARGCSAGKCLLM
eukprot:TRINITY_DN4953_c0_g1_i2.p1 TRINITY_DN4953_c0_g1~~TRINITY_DN4953_c0_g1_i2.p1  ORF type:complete len:369 (-),score=80.10 TRINITY_DN4953_c0_g1_i2:1511-2617(-)